MAGTRPILSHHRAGETSYRFCIYLCWFLCAWDPGGKITGYFGYGPEYEVAINSLFIDTVLTRTTDRDPSHPVLWRALFPKYPCPYTRRSCSRRDTDLTRPRPYCSSATSLRLAHLDLPSVDRSFTCSNEPATALFRGSWHSCEVSPLS